jgi:CubicO group peptidase (beta-lactamase class C family)
MRRFLFLSAVVGSLFLAGEARAAAPPNFHSRSTAEVLQGVDRLAAENIDPTGPGAAVLVMKDGKVVFQKGYGLADLEKKTAITPTTTFELASVSKPFTAFAILILMERGKLSLDDDIRKYVPELPVYNEKRPIRVRDLLQHTSGIPTHLGAWEITGFGSGTSADFIKRTAKKKLDFPTGSKWAYSNMNYRLLAVIVERVSGQSFPAFLQAEVFGPLGMKHTFVRDPSRPDRAGQAVGYVDGVGLIRAWKYRRATTSVPLLGEAGVWSCLEDMARWEQQLRRPTLVRKATLDLAWTAGKLDDGKPIRYGLGWFVDGTPFGRKVSHSGGWPGFTTYFLHYPERDVSVVVLTNYWVNPKAIELAERSGNLMVDRRRTTRPTLTDAQKKAAVGTYKVEGKSPLKQMQVVRRGDGLALIVPGAMPFPLVPVSEARFRLDGSPGEQIVLELEHGAVRRLRLEVRGGRTFATFLPQPAPAKSAKRA